MTCSSSLAGRATSGPSAGTLEAGAAGAADCTRSAAKTATGVSMELKTVRVKRSSQLHHEDRDRGPACSEDTNQDVVHENRHRSRDHWIAVSPGAANDRRDYNSPERRQGF